MPSWIKMWPHGKTWVFQGTVAEDATGGTHVCSLTVTPGTGNEMQLIGGLIVDGATVTNQQVQVFVDDGTNNLMCLLNPEGNNSTSTSQSFAFPNIGIESNLVLSTGASGQTWIPLLISGTMRLRLIVQTTAISVTQTFAVVCRIKGSAPTAALADTVGTPVLTTNTNRVF